MLQNRRKRKNEQVKKKKKKEKTSKKDDKMNQELLATDEDKIIERKSDAESIIKPEKTNVPKIESQTETYLKDGANNKRIKNTGTLCKEEDRKTTKLGKR